MILHKQISIIAWLLFSAKCVAMEMEVAPKMLINVCRVVCYEPSHVSLIARIKHRVAFNKRKREGLALLRLLEATEQGNAPKHRLSTELTQEQHQDKALQ